MTFSITRPSETEPNPYFTNIEGIIINTIEPRLGGTSLRIGIVQARLTNEVGSEMVKVRCCTLKEPGVAENNIALTTVPDALEVSIALMNLAPSEQSNTLIAIGIIIRGETYRFGLVSNKSGAGVSRAALDYNTPIVNVILTTENGEQTVARIGEKVSDAAKVAVECADSVNHLSPEQYRDDEE